MPRGNDGDLVNGIGMLAPERDQCMPRFVIAVTRFSSSVQQIDLRSAPIRTLSLASSKSYIVTCLRFMRAALSAASFTMLASVRAAESRCSTSHTFRLCRRIREPSSHARGESLRGPRTSGKPTTTRRSKRPDGEARGPARRSRLVRRHQDHAVVRLEAVHLNQQLVQGLFALVVSPPRPAPDDGPPHRFRQ